MDYDTAEYWLIERWVHPLWYNDDQYSSICWANDSQKASRYSSYNEALRVIERSKFLQEHRCVPTGRAWTLPSSTTLANK